VCKENHTKMRLVNFDPYSLQVRIVQGIFLRVAINYYFEAVLFGSSCMTSMTHEISAW